MEEFAVVTIRTSAAQKESAYTFLLLSHVYFIVIRGMPELAILICTVWIKSTKLYK